MNKEIKGKIIAILKDIRPYDEFSDDTDLFKSEVLDSLGFTILIAGIEDEFDIEFDESVLDIQNFSSIQKISEIISISIKGD